MSTGIFAPADDASRRDENPAGQGGVGKAETTTRELSFPDPASVKGRVLGALLRALLRRDRLTHKDCWERFGSARLSHHIHILKRKLGWEINDVDRTVSTRDAGRQATIGVYFLTDETINEAGERGQEYAAECARIEAARRAA